MPKRRNIKKSEAKTPCFGTFFVENYERTQAENPSASSGDLLENLSETWDKMTDTEKAQFTSKYPKQEVERKEKMLKKIIDMVEVPEVDAGTREGSQINVFSKEFLALDQQHEQEYRRLKAQAEIVGHMLAGGMRKKRNKASVQILKELNRQFKPTKPDIDSQKKNEKKDPEG